MTVRCEVVENMFLKNSQLVKWLDLIWGSSQELHVITVFLTKIEQPDTYNIRDDKF